MPVMITKSMRLPQSSNPQPVKLRQFESLQDAISTFGDEENLLSFINSAVLDHDRKKLRYYQNRGQDVQIAYYEQHGKFMDEG